MIPRTEVMQPPNVQIQNGRNDYNQSLKQSVKSLSSFKKPEDSEDQAMHNRLLSKYFTPKQGVESPGKKKFIINSHKSLLNSM